MPVDWSANLSDLPRTLAKCMSFKWWQLAVCPIARPFVLDLLREYSVSRTNWWLLVYACSCAKQLEKLSIYILLQPQMYCSLMTCPDCVLLQTIPTGWLHAMIHGSLTLTISRHSGRLQSLRLVAFHAQLNSCRWRNFLKRIMTSIPWRVI